MRPLAIRESDDDPDTYVVGRPAAGTFVELPAIGAEAVQLLAAGLTVGDVEQRLTEGDDRPDVAGLLDELVDLGWVAELDGRELPDPVPPRVRLGWVPPAAVGWLFSRPVVLGVWALVLAAVVTVATHPALVPTPQHFFWTDYVGLATLGNTLLFVCGGLVHESMHVAAAYSLGLPARIEVSTRLTALAFQTDVSSAWAVRRRQRYRVYLAGMAWDAAAISAALLVSAYAGVPPLAQGLLGAYVLVGLVSLALQANVYMRTDLYFVLMEALRCGDLYHDGMRYVRYLLARTVRRGTDPADEIPAREARAVRIYGPLALVSSAGAVALYAVFGVPVLVHSLALAGSAVAAARSDAPRAVDGGLVLLVDLGLLLAFLLAFRRNHAGWFRWIPSTTGRR
ncbi:MAG TPA: hypothetical protein VGP36_13450 [Mycobacteriales bacterium]|nr:hypothetical protein [Mycobacteriales bacterium]